MGATKGCWGADITTCWADAFATRTRPMIKRIQSWEDRSAGNDGVAETFKKVGEMFMSTAKSDKLPKLSYQIVRDSYAQWAGACQRSATVMFQGVKVGNPTD